MKILLVMESSHGGIGWACAQHLRSLAHEVVLFDNKANRLPLGPKTVWEFGRAGRALRLGRMSDVRMNVELRRLALEVDADLILFGKCENVTESTVRFLRRNTSAILINWNLDNPFHPSNTSIAHLRSMVHLDCYGAFARHFIPVVESLGCPRAEYWPCYFYPGLHNPAIELSAQDRAKYASDVVFAGCWSPERERALERIADLDLALWGGNWDSLRPGSPLRRHWRGRVAVGDEYVKVLKGARCVVNILNEQGKGANNLRTFEATGLGQLLVTEFSQEHAQLFIDGEEIVSFQTPEELRNQVTHYLAYPAEARRIADRGQARTLGEHTLAHRLSAILDVATEIREQRARGTAELTPAAPHRAEAAQPASATPRGGTAVQGAPSKLADRT